MKMTTAEEVYATRDLSKIANNIETWIEELTPQLRSHNDFDEEQITYFVDLCKEAARIAPSFDYSGIKSNGWRSVLRFNHHFVFKSLDALKRKEIADFLHIIKLATFFLNDMIHAHRCSEKGDKEEEANAHKRIFSEMEEHLPETMAILCNNRYLAINYPQFKLQLNLFMRILSQTYSSNYIWGARFFYLPFSIMSPQYVKMVSNLSPQKVARSVRSVDKINLRLPAHALYTLRNLFNSSKLTIKQHRVAVKSSYRFEIDAKANATVLMKMTRQMENEIKFRTLKQCDARGEFNNKLFLYIHGGGFMGPKAASLESIYFKSWCHQLKGCTCINIDYPYSPDFKFPSQIQDILDFYLWLTSDEEQVQRIIGFKPDEIVVGGESAGANLSVALVMALNDIKRMDSESRIKMPKSVVAMFGMYELPKKISASFFSAASDPVVSYSHLKAMACFARYRLYDDNNNSDNNNKSKNRTWTLGYLKDGQSISFLDDSYDAEPCPYMQCLMYDRFDDELIKSVELFVIGVDFCPLLDQSIELAKKWKGKVHFKNVDQTPHSAFFLYGITPSTAQGIMDACVTSVQEALRV